MWASGGVVVPVAAGVAGGGVASKGRTPMRGMACRWGNAQEAWPLGCIGVVALVDSAPVGWEREDLVEKVVELALGSVSCS